jgi:sulfate adenylyltransferase subunit 1 (EFTu-like GTPase family)
MYTQYTISKINQVEETIPLAVRDIAIKGDSIKGNSIKSIHMSMQKQIIQEDYQQLSKTTLHHLF